MVGLIPFKNFSSRGYDPFEDSARLLPLAEYSYVRIVPGATIRLRILQGELRIRIHQGVEACSRGYDPFEDSARGLKSSRL